MAQKQRERELQERYGNLQQEKMDLCAVLGRPFSLQ
jgi:hypothetical protein